MESTTSALAGGTVLALVIFLLITAVIGALIGALARFALPGRDDMSIGRTILYGIGGSLLGGLVGRLLGVQSQFLGFLLSVALAALLIWFFTRRKAG